MSPVSYPTRISVRRLADEIAQGRLDAALNATEALSRADSDSACEVLLASAVAGRPPEPQIVGRVLPDLSTMELLPILVGACGGDRVEMLLDCVEQDRMSGERDALALFLAVHLLDGGTPPARLATLLRLRARRRVGLEASILLALSATALGDAHVLEVAKPWLPMANVPEAKGIRDHTLHLLAAPILEVLPERAPPRVVSGFTVRRAVPKVGRNDACPCESGKKYKKCCEAKDSERAWDPSPQAGLTRLEYLRQGGAKISADEIAALRPAELAELDFPALSTRPLIVAMRRASSFQRWELAERAMEVLSTRTDAPGGGDADGYRSELISDAVRAGSLEVAERQLGLLRDRDEAVPSDLLALELHRPSERTIALLEEQAALGLQDPKSDVLVDFSFGLLAASPALGILVARASLSIERLFDAGVLVDVIEEARDRLGLPPGDPARDWYEQMLDRDAGRRIDELVSRKESSENDHLADEAEGLRTKLQESRARIADLERGLREEQSSLKVLTPPAPKAAEPAPKTPPTPASSPSNEEERRRLRAKVEELKCMLTERNQERTHLRSELARVNETLAADAAAAEEQREDDSEDDPNDAEVEAPRAVLVPIFGTVARDGLHELPVAVADKALVLIASLAAGDPAAWRQVKRMVAAAIPLLSCRVGIHHRALFRIDDRELTALAVIHRKDLDAAIRRHGRPG